MGNDKTIICVPTYKRPSYLKKNLSSILNQSIGRKFEIIVVDNDVNRSGEPSVNQMKDPNVSIEYFVENKRGISAVRNRCIQICKDKQANYLIFIDDDEIVDSNWLGNLFYVERTYNARIVVGPVLCLYEQEPSQPIKDVFFNRLRTKTGSKMKHGATGNILINMKVFKEFDNQPFHNFFNLIGGGDTYFLNKTISKGIELIWADNAIAYEFISKERSSLKNCLLRSFYRGTSAFHLFKFQNGLFKSFIKSLINTLILVLDVIRLLVFIIFINRTKMLKILKKILRSFGFILAIFNYNNKEYSTTFGN